MNKKIIRLAKSLNDISNMDPHSFNILDIVINVKAEDLYISAADAVFEGKEDANYKLYKCMQGYDEFTLYVGLKHLPPRDYDYYMCIHNQNKIIAFCIKGKNGIIAFRKNSFEKAFIKSVRTRFMPHFCLMTNYPHIKERS